MKEESKQETLEEASFRFYPEDEQWTDRHIFTLGAEWQQEQNKNLYSEEEVLELIKKRVQYFDLSINDRIEKEWFEQFKKK